MTAAPNLRRVRVRERVDEATELAAARVGVSPRALLGLLVVVALVVVVLGGRAVLAGRRSVPEPLPPPSPSLAAPLAPTSSPPVTVSRAARVAVHVVGQVRHPGVVELPAGARVQQALAAAGGALRTADLARVNLARFVVDGEQVVVPRPGEAAAQMVGPGAPVAGLTGAGAGGAGAGGADAAIAPVDLNAAGAADLDALPGVGPVLAQRILDWRSQHGRFSSVDELGEVSGIGEAVLGRLRPLVRV